MALRSQRRFIGKGSIEPGMMIEFTYQKTSGGGGSYTVLVVDPAKPNKYSTTLQLHGYSIDSFDDKELIEFFTSFGATVKIDRDNKRASVVEGLNSDKAYQSFLSSKYAQDRTYRTFNLDNMSQIRQILVGEIE